MTKSFEQWARENGLPIDADIVSTWDAGRISGAYEAWLGAIEAAAQVATAKLNGLTDVANAIRALAKESP